MKHLLVLCLAVAGQASYASPALLKVAVIDSGFNKKYSQHVKLCPSGHFNFISKKEEIGEDETGHGSHITVTIGSTNANSSYCVLVYKAFPLHVASQIPCTAIIRAVDEGALVINLSWGGEEPIECEKDAIAYAEKKHVIVIASAGNNFLNLDKRCGFYPACYSQLFPNVVSVGSESGTIANFGQLLKIRAPFCVTNVVGRLCGTSMSASEITRDFVYYWNLSHF